MARVKEIQVCGGKLTYMLSAACLTYIEEITQGTDRAKLHFYIILDDGTIKGITFRQEDDGIHVYGNFEGMPNALEWSLKVLGREDLLNKEEK